jgi:hypothetical protein
MANSTMDTSSREVSFTPWIGPRYTDGGLEGTKLLVLGESHYGEDESPQSSFTKDVVRSLVYGGRHAFFTKIAKLVVGRGTGNHIPQSEREWVWDRIAFYNYVQSLAGTGPDGTVTDSMWKEAKRPYLDVVEVTGPDAILIVGKELGRHVPSPTEEPDLEGIGSLKGTRQATIEHVSSPGFTYDPWMEKVGHLIGDHPSPSAS